MRRGREGTANRHHTMEASRTKCALCPGRQQGQQAASRTRAASIRKPVPHRAVQSLHMASLRQHAQAAHIADCWQHCGQVQAACECDTGYRLAVPPLPAALQTHSSATCQPATTPLEGSPPSPLPADASARATGRCWPPGAQSRNMGLNGATSSGCQESSKPALALMAHSSFSLRVAARL